MGRARTGAAIGGGAVLVAVLLASAACRSAPRESAWDRPAAIAGARTSSAAAQLQIQEAEALFAKRDDRASLERAIARWEQVATLDPTNEQALMRLARAYDFLASAHLGDGEQEDLELATYEKGVSAAERALLLAQPDFERAMRAGEEFKEAIGRIDARGVPSAYWYCLNLGHFAAKKGLSVRLFYKDRVEAAMKRVRELDPTFHHGGPERFLGAFYAALPSIAGKDVAQSEKYFRAAEAAAPEYLENAVVEARYLAVELEDRGRYQRLLQGVLAAAPGNDPDTAPENRAAQREAERMLAAIDREF